MLTGEALREEREVRRLSQEQLAARVSVSVRTLRRWESGETPIPRRSVNAIQQALGIASPREPTLSGASNAQLLAEIARRFEAANPKVHRDQLADEEGPAPKWMWDDPHLIQGTLDHSKDTTG